jgi:hypothetical protein
VYSSFNDLPSGIRKDIERVIKRDVDDWVHKAIPALHNKSILELMNSLEGEREVRAYLQRLESDWP